MKIDNKRIFKYENLYFDTDDHFFVFDTQRRYQEAHALIEPYIVGPDGENPGYTHLTDPQEFYDELDYLFDHIDGRHVAVADFLSQ